MLGSLVDLEASVTTGMVNLVRALPDRARCSRTSRAASASSGRRATSTVACTRAALSLSGETFGMNYGGGIYLFPSRRSAFRADVRYFRTVGDLTLDDVDEFDRVRSAHSGLRLLARHRRRHAPLLIAPGRPEGLLIRYAYIAFCCSVALPLRDIGLVAAHRPGRRAPPDRPAVSPRRSSASSPTRRPTRTAPSTAARSA